MKIVLLIDQDLGLIFGLGRVLDQAGYTALPAKTVQDGKALLAQLKISPDLVVLNPGLEGALEFAQQLHASQNYVRIIALVDHESWTVLPDTVDASYCKPEEVDNLARLEWLDVVQSVIAH